MGLLYTIYSDFCKLNRCLLYTSLPEINAEDVIAIRVTAKSSVDSTMEIFYTTSSSPNLEQSKSFNTKVTKSDDFKEYVINTAGKATWKDIVTFFRFDIISTAGEFEVSKIELLGYDESQLPITVTIDRTEYTCLLYTSRCV